MGEFISTLRENWAVIAAAPAAAITWALVIGVVLLVAVRAMFSNQIADLKSRLELRDDEIEDYRRKLDGASPDEAKARIDALEAKTEQLSKAIATIPPAPGHL